MSEANTTVDALYKYLGDGTVVRKTSKQDLVAE